MTKIFVTEAITVHTQWFYEETPVSRELLETIGHSLPVGRGWSCKRRTPEQLLAVPGSRVERTSSSELRSIDILDYTGPSREKFLKEEAGLVYFRRNYGDRAAGKEWRLPVVRTVGNLVVLDPARAELRHFWKADWKDPEYQMKEWGPAPLQGGFQFGGW